MEVLERKQPLAVTPLHVVDGLLTAMGGTASSSRLALLAFIDTKNARAKCHFDQLNNGSDRRSSPSDDGPGADNMTFHTEAHFSKVIHYFTVPHSFILKKTARILMYTYSQKDELRPSLPVMLGILVNFRISFEKAPRM